jgi:hypothetical protein
MKEKKRPTGLSVPPRGNKIRRVALSTFESIDNNDSDADPSSSSCKPATSSLSSDSDLTVQQREVIIKTAIWLSNNPDQAVTLYEGSKTNPMLNFLHNKESLAGQLFEKEVERIRVEKEATSVCASYMLPNPLQSIQQMLSFDVRSSTCDGVIVEVSDSSDTVRVATRMEHKTIRKSRWDSTTPHVVSSHPLSIAPSSSSSKTKEHAQSAFAVNSRQDELQELKLLERRIREAAAAGGTAVDGELAEQTELHLERLREYKELETDPIGGDWEHRKRAKEMLLTATKSLEATYAASGKHHIADFLPPHLRAVRKSSAAAADDAAGITTPVLPGGMVESNVGYQMLRKAGWEQGVGLGSQSNGIAQPVQPSVQSHEGAGLGLRATHEVETSDDQFGQYRKRMMQAYRFRPNPLNNPRRDYY